MDIHPLVATLIDNALGLRIPADGKMVLVTMIVKGRNEASIKELEVLTNTHSSMIVDGISDLKVARINISRDPNYVKLVPMWHQPEELNDVQEQSRPERTEPVQPRAEPNRSSTPTRK